MVIKPTTAISLTLLIPLFGCCLISSFEILDSSYLPRFIFLSFCLSIIILGLLYHQFRKSDYTIPLKNPVMISMLLWFLAAVYSVVNSINQSEWLAEVQKVFLYCVTFFVFATFLNTKRELPQEWFLKTTVIICISLTALGAYQISQFNANLTEMGMVRVTGLMSNKNLFSEYIALCFPFTIAAVFNLKKSWKMLAIISAASVLSFIVILFARSAWVALITASFFACVLLVAYKFRKAGTVSLPAKGYIRPASIIVGIIICVLLLNHFSGNEILHRFTSIFEISKGTAAGRLNIWSKTIEIIKTSFFTGVGAGNWKLVFQDRGILQYGTMYTIEPLNDYLGIFAETGVFGFIGYTGALLFAIIQFVKHIFSEHGKFPVFSFAALSSLVIYGVISGFNFPKDRIEHAVFLCFLLALSGNNLQPAIKIKKPFLVSMLLVIFAGLSYCTWSGCQRYVAEKHLRKALEARDNKQWSIVISQINKAETPYYILDPTTTPVLWYRGVAYYSLGKTDLAFNDFQSAYKANPFHIHVINNLATCYEAKNDHEKAIELYKKALSINPDIIEVALNLTAVLYNLKRYDEAISILNNLTTPDIEKDKRLLLLQAAKQNQQKRE